MRKKDYKKIRRQELLSFITDLNEKYTIYAPAKNSGPVEATNEFTFREMETVEGISLKHPPTMIPPKKYFFPSKETLFTFEDSRVNVPPTDEPFVLLGVHACDINSFLILDKMFAHGEHRDPYYERRRENGIVIGSDCEPTETCFCKSMGADKAEEGFDLFITDIPDEEAYIVTIGSATGEELTSTEAFEHVDREVAEDIIDGSLEWEEEVTVGTENLQKMVYRAFDDDTIWEELGNRCLGCGNCTMVCPCCNCFDVKDEASLQGEHVKRTRTWNACTLLEFAEVAGGNFRSSIASRYRNWIYDKYRIFPKEIEEFGCVGCGRCITYCPVRIDPREVIQEVREKHGR
ncbi:MAG: hypothetical protein GWO20_11270 [Candidatus Korarchaeota archaeon]|nr:hypothetical protein [Candidatus Korarchaeota archaeon]NIU84037.1 hypothetical protein [Candidatus Thorarchaeota archaeon]NIW14172.1 hypothetical protein [Candidatus Thorarchaeota archaeon]NIW52280.1 hypothetical protein [Candidatus Korarchaeota archaeon]